MIRRFRQQRGLTQAAFAGLVGVEQATVSRWERGGHRPDLAMQHRLRDLIGRPDRISDRLIAHRTDVAIRPMSLRRASGELVAASPSARSVLARLPPDHGHEPPAGDDTVLRHWAHAVEVGFFEGRIASLQGAGTWVPAGGGPACRGAWVWSPVTTGGGEVLLSSQFQVDAPGPPDEVVAESCTVVTMDDLIVR